MTDDKDPGMTVYSDAAWKIASLYSHILASETRDLAANIDRALAEAVKEERKALIEELGSRELYNFPNINFALGALADKIRARGGVPDPVPDPHTELAVQKAYRKDAKQKIGAINALMDIDSDHLSDLHQGVLDLLKQRDDLVKDLETG